MAIKKQGIRFEISLASKAFKKGLKGVQKASKGLVGRLKKIWAPVNKLIFGPLSAGVIAAGAGLRKLFSTIKEGAQNFIELQSAFADINSLIDGPGGLTKATKNAIRQQSILYGTSAVDNARAYYDVVSAGIKDQTEAMDLLNTANKIALTGNADVASATKALISVMKAYGTETMSAARAGDILQTVVNKGITTWPELAGYISTVASTAKGAGVSMEELSMMVAGLTAKGIDMSRTMTGIKGILNVLIADKGPAATKILEQYGIAFDVAAVKQKGFAKVMQEILDAMGGDAEKLGQIFRELEAKTGILAITADEWKNLVKDFQTTEGALTTAMQDKAYTIEAKINRAKMKQEDNLRSKEMAEGLLKWENFLTVLTRILPKLMEFGSIMSKIVWVPLKKVGGWIDKYFGSKNSVWKNVSASIKKDLKDIEDPDFEGATSKKAKKEKDFEQKMKKQVEVSQKIKDAHKDIAKITKTSVDTIAKGVEAIRKKTLDAIEKIRSAFFGGGSFAGLAEVRKLLGEDTGAQGIYEQIRGALPENIGGQGMAQVARIASEISKSGEGLSAFLEMIEFVKKINANLSVADLTGLAEYTQAGGTPGGQYFQKLMENYKKKVGAERAAGAQAEAEFTAKAQMVAQKEAIKVLKEAANKNADSAKIQAQATEEMKKAVADYQKAVDTPMTFDIILKDQFDTVIARKVQKQFEKERRTRTAGPGITGP